MCNTVTPTTFMLQALARTLRRTPSAVSFAASMSTKAQAQAQAQAQSRRMRNQTGLLYSAAVFVGFVGLSYASVPLYRLYCSATGAGGIAQTSQSSTFDKDNMRPVHGHRPLRITFNADTSRSLDWSFRPQQQAVYVVPGETALAFYTARNRSDADITGIATYNVIPAQAGPYFNKIQCFCFEQQKLRAHEEVDMPVFFFIDPDFATDPNTRDIDEIKLSYTFFNAKSARLPPALQTTA